MGGCFSADDVTNTGKAVGPGFAGGAGTVGTDSAREAAQNAASLVTGSAAYSSWVEVRVSARNLKKGDALSKSDPMAVLYAILPGGGEKELGRTDVVAASHDPVFTIPFKVLYNFERLQPLRLLIVDIDDGQKAAAINPARCDFLGELQFKLSELVTARERKLVRPLNTRSAHASQVTVTCEEVSNARDELTIVFAAVQLRNVEVMSRSDPYLEICRSTQTDASVPTWQPVYKTEVRPNNLNPVWQPVVIRATLLHNGDVHRPLLLKVYDHEATGLPEVIGQTEASGSRLEAVAASGALLPLTLPGKPNVACGSLQVQRFQIARHPTFLDYVSAGTEISFIVAVDFTASNRPPSDPASLHYLHPSGAFTPYEHALHGVGRVLEFYDSDRQYPAFGFGGQRPPGGVSHCFPLNGQPDAVCAGIPGIQQAYRTALSQWSLSGPTLFAPVIRTAAAIAAQPTPHLRYNVLLILTDGMILDMPDTLGAIVNASGLPLSILIVGIGGADFTNMHALDSDKGRLSSGGRVAERDIVQFVEFSRFGMDPEALAAELLAELPGQFQQYVRTRNIPLPAPPPPTSAPYA